MSFDSHDKHSTWSAATLAIREGISRSQEGEHSEALFLTSSYVFDSAKEAAARFSGEQPGNVYSRYTNPTVRSFEQRFAALEGAPAALAVSSGMAAILSVLVTFLKAGDQVLCSRSVFGSTISLLENFFRKMDISIDYLCVDDQASWEQCIKPNTALIFIETPSNPLNEVVDIAALSLLAKKQQALLVVDNTYCTPIFQKPLTLGADICVYSATKYIDGQGRALGGVVTGAEEHIQQVTAFIRSAGPSMSPFNAWIFLKGLETLELRMQRHAQTALTVAQWLEQHDQVEQVYYSGLSSHSQHALARSQHLNDGYAAVVSFDIKGDKQTAWRFIDALQLFSLTANLGDAKSTVVHPATTTHSRLAEQRRQAIGITQQLVRLSLGLECVQDIIEDLKYGFECCS